MQKLALLFLSTCSLVALTAFASAASAQSQNASVGAKPAAQGEGADIVVTANKPDERLVDVPASITALGGEELRD